jgi:hypothetical protein
LQIRFEASLLFFHTTTFEFETVFQIKDFVVQIQDRRLWAVRSIGLYAHSVAHFLEPETADGMHCIWVFPGLEEVRIRGKVNWDMWEGFLALKWRWDGRAVMLVCGED